MSDQDAFERVVESLYDAVLDDALWPSTAGLIDEACGVTSNCLITGEGPDDNKRVRFVGLCVRGQHRPDLERLYLETYHPVDERVPRIRQLPDSHLMHVGNLYSAEERKTSPTYNEGLVLAKARNSLNVRLDTRGGSHLTMSFGDPAPPRDWDSAQISMIRSLLPHIRHFVIVRQALIRAEARSASVTALLENHRIGVVHLDPRGQVIEVNDRARAILRRRDGLSERGGVLQASAPADQHRLERLVGGAIPLSGVVAVGGSMVFRRPYVSRPFVVHVKPVAVPQPDYGARHVAALVLIVEPGRRGRIAPALVAEALGLTTGESRVAAWLAEGKSVGDIAKATGRTRGAIYSHLKQIYQKRSITRQADLVRLVLSLAEFR